MTSDIYENAQVEIQELLNGREARVFVTCGSCDMGMELRVTVDGPITSMPRTIVANEARFMFSMNHTHDESP